MNPYGMVRHCLRRFVRAVGLTTVVVAVAAGTAACGGGDQAAGSGAAASAAPVAIKDHWERTVQVPANPQRVVVLEWEGLITKSMKIFGVDNTLVGVDSATKKMGHRAAVIPSIAKAVALGSPWSGVNYEQLAGLKPDVVFLEAWVASQENRAMHQEVIDKIESLGVPVVVLISPSNFEQPNIRTAWEHITITGQVFGKQAEATRLVERLNAGLDKVTSRTKDIPDAERTKVAYFATINNVMGTKSIQSYLLTDVVGARNVAGPGTFVTISEEKLLALDPDAMVVAGHEGYLDTSLIYGGKHAGLNWANLKDMRAIKTKRLVALGYDEWRATVETPIALLKIAKLAYPDRFADVDIVAEEIAFYRDVYGLDEAQAKAAIEAQKYVGELEVK
ncbi:ABC transporter substrate-binding protein [Micromonospora sp. ATCC 39149]|nr:ABC transporter substrate-binding protein [Micromonospora sp. ATCC 39149]